MIVVFDFDGTLANTREVLMSIYNDLAEKYGYRKVTKEDFVELRQQGYLSVLRWTGVHFWQLPKLLSEGRRLFSRRAAEVKLFPGIKELVEKLHKAGHSCYVLSSNTPRTIKKVIHDQDLEFVRVLPSASLFGKAATLKNLKKKYPGQKIVMIGDELRDINAAKRADVPVFAVNWGFQSEEMLKSAKPDVIVARPSEIIEALERI